LALCAQRITYTRGHVLTRCAHLLR
jgi:hypothetical protein